MNSFERIKDELLKQNKKQSEAIESKIDKLNQKIAEQQEQIKIKKSQIDEITAELESEAIDKEMLKDLQVLFDFMSSYNIINSVIDRISQMESYGDINIDKLKRQIPIEDVEYTRRLIFLDSLFSLNMDLFKIINEKTTEQKDTDQKTQQGKGFWVKVFNVINKSKDIMELYRETIERFRNNYNHFLSLDNQGHHIINSEFCRKNKKTIASYNRKKQLSPEEKKELELLKPDNFWTEILTYYQSMDSIKSIVDNFAIRYEKYVKLYQTHPEWFDIASLKSLIDEAPEKIKRKKSLQKELKGIEKSIPIHQRNIAELEKQKTELEKRKKESEQNQKKIKEARNIIDLGYKSTEEIAKKLNIDIKEYIIVPVPNDVSNFDELFNNEKQLKIEVNGKTFFVNYSNDTIQGKVNYLEDDRNTELVILIPINELKKEDIDNIQLGNVALNRSAINAPGVIVFKEPTREFDFKDNNIEVKNYNDIFSQVKQFLGDDFGYQGVLEIYQLFRNVPDRSPKEEKLKREAIQRGLAEHGYLGKNISVNGKPYELSDKDAKIISIMSINEPLDKKTIKRISDRITIFLRGDINGSNTELDKLYGDLLREYFKVKKKAIKEYYDEENTIIKINDKKIRIKPSLPSKGEDIVKRYTRKGEDIVYKLMKLAQLVNRFAHLADEEELETVLFQLKYDLTETAIDKSKNKTDIKIRKRFDSFIKLNSVIVEIPGYNMIALHIRNANNSLRNKMKDLDDFNGDVVSSSIIQYPGVNKDLLLTLKKEKFNKRREYIQKLDKKTFYKLIIRMGFKPEDINKSREKIINAMVSNENIDKLLGEYDGETPNQ